VEKHVLVKGREHLEEALSHGKGAIILTAHLGNWELGAHVMTQMGHEVTSIALEHQNPRVDRLLNEQRRRRGVNLLSTSGYLRGCYRALREGKIVALLGDRDVTGGGIEMEFLGKRVSLPQGPARLSVRTGAPIIPGFNLRRSNDSWHTIIEKPIYPNPDDDQEGAVRSLMEKYVPVMEEYIRWHPCQWAVFYDFWGSPAGR
jgi:KDO2-lipid IV(A) lauroyltransferase